LRIITLVERAVLDEELVAELATLSEASELVGLGLLLEGFQLWFVPPFTSVFVVFPILGPGREAEVCSADGRRSPVLFGRCVEDLVSGRPGLEVTGALMVIIGFLVSSGLALLA